MVVKVGSDRLEAWKLVLSFLLAQEREVAAHLHIKPN